jgi:phenylacetic acid degradation operon negative regulatory protein
MFGFAKLDEGLSIRPDNLVGGVELIRTELHGLGLESGALVFSLQNLDRVSSARARGLWNVAELCAGYARSLADIEASERHLTQMSEKESLFETFLLGGRVIAQILLDPLLPEPISPIRQRRALVESMKRYERVARKLWAHFLEPFAAA